MEKNEKTNKQTNKQTKREIEPEKTEVHAPDSLDMRSGFSHSAWSQSWLCKEVRKKKNGEKF